MRKVDSFKTFLKSIQAFISNDTVFMVRVANVMPAVNSAESDVKAPLLIFFHEYVLNTKLIAQFACFVVITFCPISFKFYCQRSIG